MAIINDVLKFSGFFWPQHVWRLEKTIGQYIEWKPNTKRPRGRPRQRWKNRMVKDLEKLGIENRVELSTG